MLIREIFFNFIFPKRCVSCGGLGSYLCPTCSSIIRIIENQICPICERPAIGGATHPGCRTRYSLDGLISAYLYDGPVKKAVKRLKYRPWITDLAELLTDLMVQKFSKNTSINYLIEVKPVIVPIPLHKSRERGRGFNQSEILGRLLAEKLNLLFKPNLLVRQKNTKPQTELKGKERQENIKNAFVINPNSSFLIHNSDILLVDDVWTTGATLRSCASVLKRAGTKNVWGLTLAR